MERSTGSLFVFRCRFSLREDRVVFSRLRFVTLVSGVESDFLMPLDAIVLNRTEMNDLMMVIAETTPWSATGVAIVAVLLVLASIVSWLTNLITLPGNWLCVLMLGGYVWVGPQEGRPAIGVVTLIVTFAIAFIGEVIEFFASAAGAKKAGASTKSTVYSIVGSILGAIIGGIVGVPVPIIGQAIAAIVFGGIGAAAGAMYGEWTDGRKWTENWTVGKAAFVGKLFGTLGKFSIGSLIIVAELVALAV
ncbi:DUF456 domain-containing protein [Stieleria sp. JC731]|uniref:DUF456 domain-containing protein n=1 Tax=Pirellulaceae TaxID=2691357 RepID=UPI001E5B2943|nr:DUF456 domain-containing protein [Stieleria sp. JC731]MCC9600035.1 DUF456 domain-containing protein [Stieleria sp. JC731]